MAGRSCHGDLPFTASLIGYNKLRYTADMSDICNVYEHITLTSKWPIKWTIRYFTKWYIHPNSSWQSAQNECIWCIPASSPSFEFYVTCEKPHGNTVYLHPLCSNRVCGPSGLHRIKYDLQWPQYHPQSH